jgi:hypothetical protein
VFKEHISIEKMFLQSIIWRPESIEDCAIFDYSHLIYDFNPCWWTFCDEAKKCDSIFLLVKHRSWRVFKRRSSYWIPGILAVITLKLKSDSWFYARHHNWMTCNTYIDAISIIANPKIFVDPMFVNVRDDSHIRNPLSGFGAYKRNKGGWLFMTPFCCRNNLWL